MSSERETPDLNFNVASTTANVTITKGGIAAGNLGVFDRGPAFLRGQDRSRARAHSEEIARKRLLLNIVAIIRESAENDRGKQRGISQPLLTLYIDGPAFVSFSPILPLLSALVGSIARSFVIIDR